MSYKFLPVAGLIAAALVGSTFSTRAADIKLGLAAIDLQNSFFVRMKEGGDAAAKDYGVSANWQSAQGSLDKQVGIVENFINQGVDGILIDPLDKNALIPVIKKATAKNIPVITMGNKVEAGKNYSTLYPDYENIGVVAHALGAAIGGEGQVGLLVGTRGNFVSDTREKGFVDAMKKYWPKVKIIGIEPTGWDSAKATNAAQTWLATYPDLKGIGCISDSMCLAASAVTDAMGADVKFAGYDGDAEMQPLIDSGKMVMDVLTGAQRVGYWNIAVAARLAKGEKMKNDLYMPTYFVTSKETAKMLKDNGIDVDTITTQQETKASKDYSQQLGPQQPVSAMSVK
ncbi:sugar ABC transporter substrate-binding protein [Pararhizobium mangrovi]|uniref:Substrate-binding domain-containing protein n=1 Tax=Pararhizobium mangrovi TaxID=2590452 RepID=A0A506U2E1_9HYPH|nr:sugar ABC transporter substrate-binding protein [Pararhizobium mangrovi]TPW27546.1 substrate-binding domain-containing protein [Pararhizobium mangrovi]